MKNPPVTRICDPFALVIGVAFLIEGIWGLFSPVVFFVLTTNPLHACIHLLLGVLGLWMATNKTARNYCILVGLLLLTVGVLYFVPQADALLVRLLNVNGKVAQVNIVVGMVMAVVGLVSPRASVN